MITIITCILVALLYVYCIISIYNYFLDYHITNQIIDNNINYNTHPELYKFPLIIDRNLIKTNREKLLLIFFSIMSPLLIPFIKFHKEFKVPYVEGEEHEIIPIKNCGWYNRTIYANKKTKQVYVCPTGKWESYKDVINRINREYVGSNVANGTFTRDELGRIYINKILSAIEIL